MRCSWGPQFLALLPLLAQLILPGDCNEGSSAGSCHCDKIFFSDSPPTVQAIGRFQKLLKAFDRCTPLVRFRLLYRTVCGGSKDPWVIDLISCFERRECGFDNSGRVAHQGHLPPPSTQVPESTERAPAVTGIPSQTYLPPILQSTQQPTLPVGTLNLDKKLTHAHETTTSSVGHSLEAEPEAGENQKQLEENVGPTSVVVPVLSLLVIVFILTGVLLYVLCKRRRKQSLQYSQDSVL